MPQLTDTQLTDYLASRSHKARTELAAFVAIYRAGHRSIADIQRRMPGHYARLTIQRWLNYLREYEAVNLATPEPSHPAGFNDVPLVGQPLATGPNKPPPVAGSPLGREEAIGYLDDAIRAATDPRERARLIGERAKLSPDWKAPDQDDTIDPARVIGPDGLRGIEDALIQRLDALLTNRHRFPSLWSWLCDKVEELSHADPNEPPSPGPSDPPDLSGDASVVPCGVADPVGHDALPAGQPEPSDEVAL